MDVHRVVSIGRVRLGELAIQVIQEPTYLMQIIPTNELRFVVLQEKVSPDQVETISQHYLAEIGLE